MGLHCPQRDFYLVEIVGYVSTLALLKGSRRKTMVASSVNSLSLSQICGDALGSALSLSNKVSLIPVTVRPRTLFTPFVYDGNGVSLCQYCDPPRRQSV